MIKSCIYALSVIGWGVVLGVVIWCVFDWIKELLEEK